MKPSEIRELSVEEMDIKLTDLRKELFNLNFQKATGDLQSPKRISAVKKDIARVLTIKTQLRQKELIK
ncbi:MAG: 50S ribosomal protein L29 [Candidatus Magnetoovum sp. WYHC-5]|nr:50S ribosomal protein L29 [Candidatus Magnetoovum sp. WYHC-5]